MMSPSDFCVWLQGFLAVDRTTKNLPKKDVEQIQAKLNSVYKGSTINWPPPVTADGILPCHDNLPFIPYHDPKTPFPTGDGIQWNPGYNNDLREFPRITCESGPTCSG